MHSDEARPRSLLALLILAIGVYLLFGGLFVASDAAAGPVRGTLGVAAQRDDSAEDARDYYWKAWNGFLEPRDVRVDPRRELTVVLTGEGGEPSGCAYRIAGGDLMPRTIVAKVGGEARIENRDGCTHELQSSDLDGVEPIPTAPGNARPIRVPAGGPYSLTDRVYGHVQGHIVALPDLVACGTIDDEGAYTFENVAPGTYTLKVFRDGEEAAAQEVTVTDAPLTVEPIAIGSGQGRSE